MKIRILFCMSLACITAGCSDQSNAGNGDQLVPTDVRASMQANTKADTEPDTSPNTDEVAKLETTASTSNPTATTTITVAYEIHVPTRDDLRNAPEFDP